MYPIAKQAIWSFPFIAILFVFNCHSAAALTNDKHYPVQISADKSTYNYKTGINSFEGNVKIDQGTTHLTADRLITQNNGMHKIEVATAYGLNGLAHYWTTPKPGDEPMHAYAKIIRFYPTQSNVTLEQEVTVRQGENSFQGQLIHYNSYNQTITVPALKKSRAVLVYKPD